MSKALRLSEKWFHRGLWVVALVFASFLIGLGGTLVGDLPQVEGRYSLDDFMDRPQANAARAEIKAAQRTEQAAQDALDQASLKHKAAQADAAAARETFSKLAGHPPRHRTARAGRRAGGPHCGARQNSRPPNARRWRRWKTSSRWRWTRSRPPARRKPGWASWSRLARPG